MRCNGELGELIGNGEIGRNGELSCNGELIGNRFWRRIHRFGKGTLGLSN